MARVSNANAITTTRCTLTEPNCLYLIFIFTVTMPYSFWSNDRGLWCSRWPQPIVGGDVELPTPNKPRCFPPRAAMAFMKQRGGVKKNLWVITYLLHFLVPWILNILNIIVYSRWSNEIWTRFDWTTSTKKNRQYFVVTGYTCRISTTVLLTCALIINEWIFVNWNVRARFFETKK